MAAVEKLYARRSCLFFWRLPSRSAAKTDSTSVSEYKRATAALLTLPTRGRHRHRASHVPRRSRTKLRRERQAHLLEHLLFKGSSAIPLKESSLAAARAGTEPPRTTAHLSELRRDRATRCRSPEADRMVNSQRPKQDLDSEIPWCERVEMGENNPARCSYAHERSPILAHYGPDHRQRPTSEDADREAAGLLPHLVPARQRAAHRRRQLRREARARAGGPAFRTDPETGPLASDALHRRTDAGRRAQCDVAPGRREPDPLHPLSRAGGPPHRLSAIDVLTPSWATCPRDACIALWCRRGSRATSGARSAACTIRDSCTAAAPTRCPRTEGSKQCERRCSPWSRT